MLSAVEIDLLLSRCRSGNFRRKMRLLRLIAYVVERPLVPDVRFDLLALSDADSTLKFRFDVAGVQALVSALRLPVVIITSSRDRCLSTEALCITLYRMSYPRRYYDMMATFGRYRESICRIFNDVIDALYTKWNQVLYFCQHIVADRLPAYSSAIVSKGSPMEKIFGFIDGSKFETCRITQKRSRRQLGFSDMQRLLYSGHKRRHCLNFQAVTAPDGLCVHFWGPMEGSRHDTTMLRLSKLQEYLNENRHVFDGYLIYGDPAYGVLDWVCSGFKGSHLDQPRRDFNVAMSRVRQSVEWSFGAMKQQWAMVAYKMQQKIMLQNVGKVILVAMLFSNCHCCYYGGNQISDYFGIVPPSLCEYLVLPEN